MSHRIGIGIRSELLTFAVFLLVLSFADIISSSSSSSSSSCFHGVCVPDHPTVSIFDAYHDNVHSKDAQIQIQEDIQSILHETTNIKAESSMSTSSSNPFSLSVLRPFDSSASSHWLNSMQQNLASMHGNLEVLAEEAIKLVITPFGYDKSLQQQGAAQYRAIINADRQQRQQRKRAANPSATTLAAPTHTDSASFIATPSIAKASSAFDGPFVSMSSQYAESFSSPSMLLSFSCFSCPADITFTLTLSSLSAVLGIHFTVDSSSLLSSDSILSNANGVFAVRLAFGAMQTDGWGNRVAARSIAVRLQTLQLYSDVNYVKEAYEVQFFNVTISDARSALQTSNALPVIKLAPHTTKASNPADQLVEQLSVAKEVSSSQSSLAFILPVLPSLDFSSSQYSVSDLSTQLEVELLCHFCQFNPHLVVSTLLRTVDDTAMSDFDYDAKSVLMVFSELFHNSSITFQDLKPLLRLEDYPHIDEIIGVSSVSTVRIQSDPTPQERLQQPSRQTVTIKLSSERMRKWERDFFVIASNLSAFMLLPRQHAVSHISSFRRPSSHYRGMPTYSVRDETYSVLPVSAFYQRDFTQILVRPWGVCGLGTRMNATKRAYGCAGKEVTAQMYGEVVNGTYNTDYTAIIESPPISQMNLSSLAGQTDDCSAVWQFFAQSSARAQYYPLTSAANDSYSVVETHYSIKRQSLISFCRFVQAEWNDTAITNPQAFHPTLPGGESVSVQDYYEFYAHCSLLSVCSPSCSEYTAVYPFCACPYDRSGVHCENYTPVYCSLHLVEPSPAAHCTYYDTDTGSTSPRSFRTVVTNYTNAYTQTTGKFPANGYRSELDGWAPCVSTMDSFNSAGSGTADGPWAKFSFRFQCVFAVAVADPLAPVDRGMGPWEMNTGMPILSTQYVDYKNANPNVTKSTVREGPGTDTLLNYFLSNGYTWNETVAQTFPYSAKLTDPNDPSKVLYALSEDNSAFSAGLDYWFVNFHQMSDDSHGNKNRRQVSKQELQKQSTIDLYFKIQQFPKEFWPGGRLYAEFQFVNFPGQTNDKLSVNDNLVRVFIEDYQFSDRQKAPLAVPLYILIPLFTVLGAVVLAVLGWYIYRNYKGTQDRFWNDRSRSESFQLDFTPQEGSTMQKQVSAAAKEAAANANANAAPNAAGHVSAGSADLSGVDDGDVEADEDGVESEDDNEDVYDPVFLAMTDHRRQEDAEDAAMQERSLDEVVDENRAKAKLAFLR